MTKSKIKKPVNHHDMFFKSVYSDPKFALELFQLIFSKEELEACDWKNLKPEKDSLKEKRADLVFSVPLKTDPKTQVKIFILLEHKSYYEPAVFNKMLYYMTTLHENSLKAGTVSLIMPVLCYHGKTPWKWAKTFQETVYKDLLSKIPAQFRENMIDYKVRLLDLNDPKFEEVLKDQNVTSRGALNVLREIWYIRQATLDKFKRILALFSNLPRNKKELMISVLDYLQSVFGEDKDFKKRWKNAEQELIREGILKEGGYMNTLEYMSIREQKKGWKKGLKEGHKEGRQEGLQEGHKEGRQEERQQVILNMLKEKLDIALVSKVTGVSVKEIKKLKNGS